MFKLYNWNLYGKSPYDYLKQSSNPTRESQTSYQESSNVNKKYIAEELREIAKRDLTDEEINKLFELEKNKTVKASQQEINQLRGDINLTRLEALEEGRKFGVYQGAYQTLYPNLGLLQHQREDDTTFKSKTDKTLFNLEKIRNIQQMNAKNYEELEDEIVKMSLNEDERVDKTFFNQQGVYSKYKEREDEYINNINSLQKTKDDLTSEISNTQKSISNYDESIKNIVNDEKYKELTEKENELKINLENIALKLGSLPFNPYKLKNEMAKIDKSITEEKNKSPLKSKREGTPKKKSTKSVSKKTTTKPTPELDKFIKEKAELQKKLDGIRKPTQEEEDIYKDLDKIEKQKNKLSNKYVKKKEEEEEKLKNLENELSNVNSKLSDYNNEYNENKKKMNEKRSNIKKNLINKVGNDPLSALVEGVKIGNKGQLYMGPTINYMGVDYKEESKKTLDQKLEEYIKSINKK